MFGRLDSPSPRFVGVSSSSMSPLFSLFFGLMFDLCAVQLGLPFPGFDSFLVVHSPVPGAEWFTTSDENHFLFSELAPFLCGAPFFSQVTFRPE